MKDLFLHSNTWKTILKISIIINRLICMIKKSLILFFQYCKSHFMVIIYGFETEQANSSNSIFKCKFKNISCCENRCVPDATCLQKNTRLNLKMSWFEFFSPRRGVSDSSLSFCMVSLYYPKMTDYDYQSVPGANSLAAAGNI